LKTRTYYSFPLIFYLAAAYSAGVAAAFTEKCSLRVIGLVTIFSLLLWAVLFLLGAGARGKCRIFFMVSVLVLLGMFVTALKIDLLKQSRLLQLARSSQVMDLCGTTISEPEATDNSYDFTLRVEQIKAGADGIDVSEAARVSVDKGENAFDPPAAGERIRLLGVVPRIPASENYRRSLYLKGVQVLFSTDPSNIRKIKDSPLLPRLLSYVRSETKRKVLRFLNRREAGLLLGIMLGDKENVTSLTQSRFARAGVAHVIVVSGLHVGMIALIGFGLAGAFKLEPWPRVILTMSLVILYALITGCRPSVLRAALVIGIGLCGWSMGKDKDLIAPLSAAALILLIYDPFFLFDIAFQLSFAATLSIAILMPILQSQFDRFPLFSRRPAQIFLVSIAVQIGVVPILMYHFGELSLISALANVIIVPLIAPVLALGLLAVTLSFLFSILAHPLFVMLGLLLSLINSVTSFMAELPFSWIPATMSLTAVLVYFLLLVALVVLMRQSQKRFSGMFLLSASLVMAAGMIWWQVLANAPPQRFTADFLDVGQGDAAAVRTPAGACILIDGGPDRYAAKSLLASKGIRRIDLLVLSHPHADHLNGLIELAEGYDIGIVLMNKCWTNSEQYREFKAAISERRIPKIQAKEGMKLQVGPDLKLVVLSEDRKISAGSDLNNESLVMKVEYQDLSILFAGDVEEEEELQLLHLKHGLHSYILKVPHHGSINGAERTFLKYVRPKAAIISVGKNNRFGHPSGSTLHILRSLGAKIYRTDEDGNVTITSDGKGFAVSTSR
jgi:competence protein ComEC